MANKIMSDSAVVLKEAYPPHFVKGTNFWPAKDNTAWYFGSDGRLHHIDKMLKELADIGIDCDIHDICTDPLSGKVYCCCYQDHSIREVDTKEGTTKVIFNTPGDPWHILFTYNKQIVVSMMGLVCLYDLNGKVLHSFTHDGGYVPALSLSEETHDIIVARAADGLIVLNDELKLEYECKGEDIPVSEDDKREKLCYYSAVFVDRYIIAGDRDNREIHILDGDDGKYIRTLHIEGMSDVYTLGVQQDNKVLMAGCFGPQKIMSFKFSM